MDTKSRLRIEFRAVILLLGIIALIPTVVSNDYWLGVLIVSMYFAMVATGWNILAGYTGQFSFAPATFGMLGAYATGLADYHFGLPEFVEIPLTIVVSAMISLLLGRIVLRFHGPNLALTTLAFAEVVRAEISALTWRPFRSHVSGTTTSSSVCCFSSL